MASLINTTGNKIPNKNMIAVLIKNGNIYHMNKMEMYQGRETHMPIEDIKGSIIVESYIGYRNSHNVDEEDYDGGQQKLMDFKMKSGIEYLSEFARKFNGLALHMPFNMTNLNKKERMPLLHHSLSILATLNRDKIYLYEFFGEQYNDKKVADLSINIPNSKHGYVAMWNKCEMSTIGIGTDGGIFTMRNIYPEIGTRNITEHYKCDFFEGPAFCKIDTIDFDPYGENVIGSGPGICGFILWDLNSGDNHNYCSGTEQIKILKYSTDSDFILSVSSKDEIVIWYKNVLHFEKVHLKNHSKIACAEWRPSSNDIIFFFKDPGLINMLNLKVSQHGQKLIRTSWVNIPIPEQLRLININTMAHVKAIVWGEKGQKLALAIGSPHDANGCIALLSITLDGLYYISNFIGYARPKAWSDVIGNRGVNMGFSVQNLREHNESLICISDNGAMSFIRINDF